MAAGPPFASVSRLRPLAYTGDGSVRAAAFGGKDERNQITILANPHVSHTLHSMLKSGGPSSEKVGSAWQLALSEGSSSDRCRKGHSVCEQRPHAMIDPHLAGEGGTPYRQLARSPYRHKTGQERLARPLHSSVRQRRPWSRRPCGERQGAWQRHFAAGAELNGTCTRCFSCPNRDSTVGVSGAPTTFTGPTRSETPLVPRHHEARDRLRETSVLCSFDSRNGVHRGYLRARVSILPAEGPTTSR